MELINGNLVGLKTIKEPSEGRAVIVLSPMTFVTGAEQFLFSSDSLRNQKLITGIQTVWIDATGMTPGKNAYVQMQYQKLVVPGGKQGFYAVTAPVPLNFVVTADGGTTGIVKLNLYNFEVLPGESQTIQTVAGALTSNQGAAGIAPWLVKLDAAQIPLSVTVNNFPVVPVVDMYSAANAGVVVQVKAGAGKFHGMMIGNTNATPVYVQLFDVAAVVLGATMPKIAVMVPANGAVFFGSEKGISFLNALQFACTTLRSNAVAPATPVDVNIEFE